MGSEMCIRDRICSSLKRDRFIIVYFVNGDSTRIWRKFRGAGQLLSTAFQVIVSIIFEFTGVGSYIKNRSPVDTIEPPTLYAKLLDRIQP